MILPEEFQSDRLTMRRFIEGDESWIFDYASDPEVTRYMDWPTHRDIADTFAYLRMIEDGWSSGTEYAWAITLKAGSMPVGAIGCGEVTHSVSFGYVLGKASWGRGYATEASRALHGFFEQVPGLERIWAWCDVDNLASAHVLEKLGMEQEGVLRKWKIRPNMPGQAARDSKVFARIISN